MHTFQGSISSLYVTYITHKKAGNLTRSRCEDGKRSNEEKQQRKNGVPSYFHCAPKLIFGGLLSGKSKIK